MQFDLFDDEVTPILESRSYAEFKRRLVESECRRCDLHHTRRHIVVDRGNPQSPIMLIGEGPGEQEDLAGKAFVGRAGKLLDEIFEEHGLDTNRHTLICNVVKCRPPGNRVPNVTEVQTCLPYLQAQMALVRPRLVILLGATALRHMAPDRKGWRMEDEAGKFFRLPTHPYADFVVLYHTAALLRNPRLSFPMREHMEAVTEYIERERLRPS
jgi:uracil-DNA glycosylase family 4